MQNKLTVLCLIVLVVSLFVGFLPKFVSATTTVPTGTYLAMPTYSSNFNFAVNQTFNDLYLTSSGNASYPEYWFMTLTTGSTYGLSSDANFTVSTLFSGYLLEYQQHTAGTVYIYSGNWGQPTAITGNQTSSYNAATNVTSIFTIGGTAVWVSWASSSPIPTPAPTTAPTASVSLTINQPTVTTYSSSSILTKLTASGGTVDKVWFNVKNGSSWVYTSSIIYTAPYLMTGYANGSYTLYAFANNTAGSLASASVAFTVAVPSAGYSPGLPSVSIGRPLNQTYTVSTIAVSLTSTNADATWYNVKNGSSWVYTYNQTYSAATSITGYTDGTYTFYAFCANSGGASDMDTVVFTVDSSLAGTLPVVDVGSYWLFFYEGNYLGFFQAFFISSFGNLETAIALIVFLFMVPIYLRTKSLLLLCIIWILLGSFLIVAFPLASGIAVLFMALAIGGLLYRLFADR